MSDLSVIIRCKNEERWIGHAIQSVLDKAPKSEIITIVDRNSSDESVNIINMFKKWNDLKIIYIDNYSPGKAINLGVENSSKQYVLVLSSHCVINNINEENLIRDLDKYVCVFGKQIPVYKGKKITPRYIWSHFVNERADNMFSFIENRYFLHNAIAVYNKYFLLKYKFDETLYGKEDRYWAADIVSKNFRYLYDPELSCFHHWTENGATWKGIG